MYIASLYKKKWWIWSDGGPNDTMRGCVKEPEEMPVEITDALENTDKIYIWDLSYYKDDIFRVLYHIGYTFLDGNPKIKEMPARSIKYLISHLGDCYKITCRTDHKHTCTIYDAKKIIPLYSLDDVLTSFSRDSYNLNPSIAVWYGIKEITKEHDGCTISGIARRSWSAVTRHEIKELVLDMNEQTIMTSDGGVMTAEDYIRPAYHGGICIKKDDDIRQHGAGICLDVNSLYPYEMEKPMPVGVPYYHDGKPSENAVFRTRIGQQFIYMRIRLKAEIKPDHIPCITASGSPQEMSYRAEGSWISKTYHDGYKVVDGRKVPQCFYLQLTITWQEWELIQEQYNIYDVIYMDYIVYNTNDLVFRAYIDKWYRQKQKNSNNKGRRKVAKMMENGLSGSFARNHTTENFVLRYDDETDKPVYHVTETVTENKSYIHIGAAITALARVDIIRKAQQHYDRWLYTDTDSIFLEGSDIPGDFEISDKLGDFKVEKEYSRIEFLKSKTYGYIDKTGKLQLTLAGVSGPGKEYMLAWLNHEISSYPKYWQECSKVINSHMKLTRQQHAEYLEHKKYLDAYIHADHDDPLEEIREWECPTLVRQHTDMFDQTYFKQWNMVTDMNDYLRYY